MLLSSIVFTSKKFIVIITFILKYGLLNNIEQSSAINDTLFDRVIYSKVTVDEIENIVEQLI